MPRYVGSYERMAGRQERQRRTSVMFPWEAPRFESALGQRQLRILNAVFLGVVRAGGKGQVGGGDRLETSVVVHGSAVAFRLSNRADPATPGNRPRSGATRTLATLLRSRRGLGRRLPRCRRYFSRVTAGIEPAGPGPGIFAGRHAGANRDRADAHVTVIDVPAFVGGFRIAAAEGGHGAIKAPRAAVGKRAANIG
jgi:hypothetical protein